MWDYNDRVWGKMMGNYGPGELMAEWGAGIPMKRAGTPAEVAGLDTFLARPMPPRSGGKSSMSTAGSSCPEPRRRQSLKRLCREYHRRPGGQISGQNAVALQHAPPVGLGAGQGQTR